MRQKSEPEAFSEEAMIDLYDPLASNTTLEVTVAHNGDHFQQLLCQRRRRAP